MQIGEGNSNPLQCSCLENPRDGGAWWPAIYVVAQSWTRLKRLSSSSSSSSMSQPPPWWGGLLFSELQKGRGAEQGHEVSKSGVRLGLSDTQMRPLTYPTPLLPKSSEGRNQLEMPNLSLITLSQLLPSAFHIPIRLSLRKA